MRTPFDIDDFESYLEQEVNQHRMYPSDYVWRNIQQDLHGYKKWPALTVITLFVISALVVGTLLIKPKQQPVANAQGTAGFAVGEPTAKNEIPKENSQQHFSPEHITQQTMASVILGDVDIDSALQTAFNAYHGVLGLTSGTVLNENADVTGATSTGVNILAGPATNTAASNGTNVVAAARSNKVGLDALSLTSPQTAANSLLPKQGNTLLNSNARYNWMKAAAFDGKEPDWFHYRKGVWQAVYGSIFYLSADRLSSSHSVDYTPMYNIEKKFTNQTARNTFKLAPKSGGFDVQVYFTPSVSYHVISHAATKSNVYLPGATPNSPSNVVDVNALVHNTSAVAGYQAGAAIGYKLSNTLTLRTGLQFNYSQYGLDEINTTPTPMAQSAGATSNNNGVAGGSNISMQTALGKQPANGVITNIYYQIALPVGIDWKAWASKKFAWDIAASVQPNYTIYKTPFMVATANSNYADGAAMMRKWNINSSIESYLSYTTGKYKWQLGPQVGYQLLSSLKGGYPITEHLLNYGIKIGVVRSLP